MNLEDKIIQLRKKRGWSQEELAGKLDVSRQAVSKWESGISMPEIDKIVQMSELFDVSTDYLLKSDPKELQNIDNEASASRFVSLAEANEFLEMTKHSIWKIAIGVMLCVLSPITLMLLCGLSEEPYKYWSDSFAVSIGLSVLFVLVATAVAIFIVQGMKYSKYEYLNKESIYLPQNTKATIISTKEEYKRTYTIAITIATVLCVLSIIPLIILGSLDINDFYTLIGVSILLGVCSIAVFIFTIFGGYHLSLSKLLQEGDYSVERKKRNYSGFTGAYWCFVTIIFILVSFITQEWGFTWIIWAVAGILYGGICAILSSLNNKK